MTRNNDSKKVLGRLRQQLPVARHGLLYYTALFLIFFGIPLYIALQFFSVYESWDYFDLIFVFILGSIAVHGLYSEFRSTRTLGLWFTAIGVVSGIVMAIVAVFIH